MRLLIELEIDNEVVKCEYIRPDELQEKIKSYGRQGLLSNRFYQVFYRQYSSGGDLFDEISAEQEEEIKKLRSNHSLREIAEMFNVGKHTIFKILKSAS